MNTGSCMDILFKSTFNQLKINSSQLMLGERHLIQDYEEWLGLEGILSLPFNLGTSLCKLPLIEFYYCSHAIRLKHHLGRMTLNEFKAIVSSFHLYLNFLTLNRIATILGNLSISRRCYLSMVALKYVSVEENEMEEVPNCEPSIMYPSLRLKKIGIL